MSIGGVNSVFCLWYCRFGVCNPGVLNDRQYAGYFLYRQVFNYGGSYTRAAYPCMRSFVLTVEPVDWSVSYGPAHMGSDDFMLHGDNTSFETAFAAYYCPEAGIEMIFGGKINGGGIFQVPPPFCAE